MFLESSTVKALTRATSIFTLLALLPACAILGIGSRHIDYRVGFTTTDNNEVFVRAAHFDDTWGGPVGFLSCCWDVVGATVSPLYRPMPRKAYLRWHQTAEEIVYEATLSLPKNIGNMARQMPEYELISSGEKRKRVYLVFGMKPDGQIEAWLTNAGSDRNTRGRVRHVVAQAQGTVVEESNNDTNEPQE